MCIKRMSLRCGLFQPMFSCVCQAVCLSVTHLRPAKAAERIKVLFVVESRLLVAQGTLHETGTPKFPRGFDAAFAK